jgi:LCP family protein required for cell wall assembly
MLLVKPKKGATALISIPRDTFVTVDGTDMKINSVAQNYGWKKLSAQVENISGLKVDHFVRIGFGGVKNVVDALGGVKLCYDSTVNDVNSGLKWTAGCHTADGDTALAFSRMRYSDPEGDFGRTKRQRQVIQAIAKKAASKSTLTNFSKTQKVVKSALSAIKVDEDASPYSLLKMAMAFKDATGSDGITGTIYYSNPSYYPPSGIGSTVLMDSDKTSDLFTKIANGTQKKGTVGGYSE